MLLIFLIVYKSQLQMIKKYLFMKHNKLFAALSFYHKIFTLAPLGMTVTVVVLIVFFQPIKSQLFRMKHVFKN